MISSDPSVYSYSTTDYRNRGENFRKTFNTTVTSASSFIGTFVSGRSGLLFGTAGNVTPDYFVRYYMQTWTRA